MKRFETTTELIAALTDRTYETNGRTVYAGHVPFDIYVLGTLLPETYIERTQFSDGNYRAVWYSDIERSSVSYCEHDVLITKHADRLEYEREIDEAIEFYKTH
jgi:hypothetical protein